MDSKVKPPKEKRRNSERRKEKSRDAARCRRSKENDIFHDMASLLPLPTSVVSSLDKASIMRLAISFLKTKSLIDIVPKKDTPNVQKTSNNLQSVEDAHFLKAVDGFLFIMSTDGDLVYLSENVNEHLGLSQIDLMGQSIYELTHPCDHNELKSVLSTKELGSQKSIFIRLKCTLTCKGRSINVKSASYKVIHCTGHLVKTDNHIIENKVNNINHDNEDINNNENDIYEDKENDFEIDEEETTPSKPKEPSYYFIAIGEPIPHPANYEIPLSRHTFLTKHSLDMKFTYADETMEDFLKFNPDTFISKSLFDYHHAGDSFHVQNAFKNLFAKGQCQTDRYRFLAYGGGYIWVVTQATMIYNKSQKAQSVVCVNFVISEIEYPGEIYSICQIPKESSALPTIQPVQPLPSVVKTATTVQQHLDESIVQITKPVTSVNIPQEQSSVVKPFVQPQQQQQQQVIRPVVKVLPLKPVVAPLEEVLPLPTGITVPKVQNHQTPISLVLPLQDNTNTKSTANSVTSKFLATFQQDNPLVRAIIAENNALTQAPRPQPATAKIFAKRTQEMNKGYLMFADDDTGLTMLKDDPEDITHLAPTPGDVCVPLDSPDDLLMGDLLDEFILPDNYCPLLSDACDDSSSPTKDMSPPHSFFTYRDDRSLSPSLTHSPGGCSLPSLSSVDSPPTIEDTSMSSFWGLELVDSSEDLSIRAPYIPMSVCDDLPLLTARDLMWGSHSVPKPIISQDHSLSKHSWSKNSQQQQQQHSTSSKNKLSSAVADDNSSLAKLLRSESSNQKIDDGGGGENVAQLLRYKYSTKKGNNGSTVLEVKKGNKRCATPPEWDHRGYWKRSKTPTTQQQQQSNKHNSVLMNLLVSGCDDKIKTKRGKEVAYEKQAEVTKRIRLRSLTGTDSDSMTSFDKLTNQDFEVNAPTSNLLLGEALLIALENYKA